MCSFRSLNVFVIGPTAGTSGERPAGFTFLWMTDRWSDCVKTLCQPGGDEKSVGRGGGCDVKWL